MQDHPSRASRRRRDPQRDRAVRRVLAVVLLLNLLVAVTKLSLGFMIGAVALVADGLHSLLDGSANVVGLIGMAVAARPPDREHPYGHRRFETIAALVIGLLIALGLYEVASTVIERAVSDHAPPAVDWISAAIVAATIVINIGISRYERHQGKKHRSSILVADSGHTFSDALAATAVLLSFGGVAIGFAQADLVAAAVVCVFIGRTAWQVIGHNLGILSDKAQLTPEKVHTIVVSVDGVHGAHLIRSRGPSDFVQVDLHIQLAPSLSLRQAHELTHRVEDALHEAFPEIADVVIHTEPADGHEDEAPVAPNVGAPGGQPPSMGA